MMINRFAGKYADPTEGFYLALAQGYRVEVVFVAGNKVRGEITYTQAPNTSDRSYIVTDRNGKAHDIDLSVVHYVELLNI